MEPIATTATFVLNANELIAAFTNFLQFDVAAGGVSAETIRTYWCEAKVRFVEV
jgi:integrase/recombinase XerD